MISQLRTIWTILQHTPGFRRFFGMRSETVQYPEEMPYLAPRYRGRIVLTRDPDGEERCVACNLCAVACPVDCIALQKTEKEDDGRWYPEFFRINFSRCIMCGLCEEACPKDAIHLSNTHAPIFKTRGEAIYDLKKLTKNWNDVETTGEVQLTEGH